MKGKVCGPYVAVVPDDVDTDLKINEGALAGFEIAADSDKRKRMEIAAQTGIVYQVGPLAYDYTDDEVREKAKCEVGDRVWFVRHVSKIVEDKDNKTKDGKPSKIFVMTEDNIIWNEGKAEAKDE